MLWLAHNLVFALPFAFFKSSALIVRGKSSYPILVLLLLNLLLQHHHALQHGFRAWGTAGDIDSNRQNRIDALHGGVVIIESASASTHAERNAPFGLAHLIVHTEQDGLDLLADRAHDEEHVRLARGETRERGVEAVEIVMRDSDGHVFHAAARSDERILKDGIFALPVDRLIKTRGDEVIAAEKISHSHSKAPLFQA